jgi:anti-anti-sigma factor
MYADEQQRRTGVTAWVRRGLETDAKIVYVESPDEQASRSLIRVLLDEHIDVTSAVSRRQLEIVDPDVGLGPAWQAQLVDDGLAAGYSSVRLGGAADTSCTVMSPSDHADAERAADELCLARPAAILCQYATSLPASMLQRACSMHTAGIRGTTLQIFPIHDGVALAGEIDLSDLHTLRSALGAFCARTTEAHPKFVIDLAELNFLDVAGARVLVSDTSPIRDQGVVVQVRGAGPMIHRLLRQLGVDRIDGFVLEDPS